MAEDTFCIECHGRGLDSNDQICPRCHGTGNEPERVDLDDIEADLLLEEMLLGD